MQILIVCYRGRAVWKDVIDLSTALDFSVCTRMLVLVQIYQTGNADMLLQDLYELKEGIGLLVC